MFVLPSHWVEAFELDNNDVWRVRDPTSALLFCSILALLTLIVGDRVGHVFVQIIGEFPVADPRPKFDGENAFCLALVGRDVAALCAGSG